MSTTHKFRAPTIFSGLKGFSWANLPNEISAGITLAALIIPLNIGYAQVAGLPPVFGLYAGIIPLAIFALFTGSPHLVGSPDASSSAIVGAILIGFAPIGELRMDYALALALMSGLLFLVFWLFRLAFLVNFLSRAVLIGFISGLGIEVLTNQIRKILGVVHVDGAEMDSIAHQLHNAMATSVDTTGYFMELFDLIVSIPHANLYSVAIGLGAFVILRLMKRYLPKVPSALVALFVMTVVVTVFGLDQKGVAVLGEMAKYTLR
ncbi:MAG: SulP family sulfate permease [Desulforhopalus sp.]|jgi:SulP family sulfate permease